MGSSHHHSAVQPQNPSNDFESEFKPNPLNLLFSLGTLALIIWMACSATHAALG